MKLWILILTGWAFFGAATLSAQTLELGREQVETAALESSSMLRALRAERDAVQARQDVAGTALWPRLAFDANERYVTVVPEFSLNPKAPPVRFGDNQATSVGLGLNWTLWDGGNAFNQSAALRQVNLAKQRESEGRERETRLRARLSYIQVLLASERSRVVADSLRLAQNQARDLDLRLKAGASSRLDYLTARNEVLQKRGLYRQTQADLSAATRDLLALTGLGKDSDPSVPQTEAVALSPPAETKVATLTLRLDSLEKSLDELRVKIGTQVAQAHPQLAVQLAMAESLRKQAAAAGSGHWPSLRAGARASYDYPNGPVLEQIQQNTFTASFNWPLFSFGQEMAQAREQEALAQAADARASQVRSDLSRDWAKSQDRLRSLEEQRELDQSSVGETGQLYTMTYASYQNGSSSFLEVQSAELRALEAKVRKASTEAQILIELSVLSSLSE